MEWAFRQVAYALKEGAPISSVLNQDIHTKLGQILKYKQPSHVPVNTRETAFQNRDSTVMDVRTDTEMQLWSLDTLATDQRPNARFILHHL